MKNNITFLKSTNKFLEIAFKLILRYLTLWVLVVHLIYYIGFKNIQYSLLFLSLLVSSVGLILTYIYPKKIYVPYLNLTIKNTSLKIFDLLFHQLPLILLIINYNKSIKNDNLIFALLILVLYLLINNPFKVYNLHSKISNK